MRGKPLCTDNNIPCNPFPTHSLLILGEVGGHGNVGYGEGSCGWKDERKTIIRNLKLGSKSVLEGARLSLIVSVTAGQLRQMPVPLTRSCRAYSSGPGRGPSPGSPHNEHPQAAAALLLITIITLLLLLLLLPFPPLNATRPPHPRGAQRSTGPGLRPAPRRACPAPPTSLRPSRKGGPASRPQRPASAGMAAPPQGDIGGTASASAAPPRGEMADPPRRGVGGSSSAHTAVRLHTTRGYGRTQHGVSTSHNAGVLPHTVLPHTTWRPRPTQHGGGARGRTLSMVPAQNIPGRRRSLELGGAACARARHGPRAGAAAAGRARRAVGRPRPGGAPPLAPFVRGWAPFCAAGECGR